MPIFDTFRTSADRQPQDNDYKTNLYLRKIDNKIAKVDPRNYKQMVAIYAENEEVDLRQLDSYRTYHQYRNNINNTANNQLPNRKIPLAPFPKKIRKSYVRQFLEALIYKIK